MTQACILTACRRAASAPTPPSGPAVGRLWPTLVAAAVLGLPAITRAGGLDLLQFIPRNQAALRGEAMQAQRAMQQAQTDQACAKLKAWIDAGPLPWRNGPASGIDTRKGAAALVADDRFRPTFGKAYDEMPGADLAALGHALPYCFSSRGALSRDSGTPWQLRAPLAEALDPARQPVYAAQLQTLRRQHGELEQVTAQLASLPATPEGYVQLKSLRQQGQALLGNATEAQGRAFGQALDAAALRVAAPQEAAQIDAAVAAAHGIDGLRQLEDLWTRLQAEGVGGDVGRAHLQTLQAAINRVGDGVLAEERARLDAMGSGLAALATGRSWPADYAQRLQPLTRLYQPLAGLPDAFMQRRVALLGAAAPPLRQAIQACRSNDELATLQQRYLMPTDGNTVPGTALLSAFAEQQRVLDKRAALGDHPEADDAPVAAAPATPRRGAAAAATAPAGDDDQTHVAGEPSASVIYDLVRQRFDNEAQHVNNTLAMCNAGAGQSNMMDAAACLSTQLYGAMGAGAPVRIEHFEKLGCASARGSGKPGYYCEFDYTVTGGTASWIGPVARSLQNSDGVNSARFLHRRDGWTMITEGE